MQPCRQPDNFLKLLGSHNRQNESCPDTNFMKSLEEFDKDNIPDAVIKKLKKYIDDPQYQPDVVAKQSRAAMSLCMWTRAMDVYEQVATPLMPIVSYSLDRDSHFFPVVQSARWRLCRSGSQTGSVPLMLLCVSQCLVCVTSWCMFESSQSSQAIANLF